MKKVLVLGATGGMGREIVSELTDRGIEVIAFARKKERLIQIYESNRLVKIRCGDMLNIQDVLEAAKGTDVIIHSVNVPYEQWQEKLFIIMKHAIKAAQENNAKLAIVDNIDAYGKGNREKLQEDLPKQPHTKKGKIRLELENVVKSSKVSYLIAHFPDFYGPHAENALLNYYLHSVVGKKRPMFVGNPNVMREYIYTPDGAKAMVNLVLSEAAYGQNWNIPAAEVITGNQIFQIVESLTNKNGKPVIVNKMMIRMIGLFNKTMREAVEMLYLMEEPIVLDGTKYEREIGTLPKTPYEAGIRETLAALRKTEKNN
ncbi:Nucleoside-diphosphate-sugar epimerase [Gracilibacillus ureilyticus]|uniref:Nucleoside-diphosphate-sugar epimerase n=1 Tax=Gracilibacillus ureilyticus TaxID=531814 RepID=A0A1H9P709_9BACI|nr:SDR family NAD(P)-dependent oxidoreductase [Gracilibacillus ureilyticus]SER43980.1 Nucleoside-diphosphate-sugar epimerase [Gracilibacillus ureilyticus]